MKKHSIITAMALAGSLMASGAAKADILVMGIDKENEAVIGLTNTSCIGTAGNLAVVYTKDRQTFMGCWTGDGLQITIYFGATDKRMTYDTRMFFNVDQFMNKLSGGIGYSL